MIIMRILVIFVAFAGYFSCDDLRLDIDPDTKVEMVKFTKSGDWYTTGSTEIPVKANNPVYVDFIFPSAWTIAKIVVLSKKTQYESFVDGKISVASMYNFEIKSMNKSGTFNTDHTYTNNTLLTISVKEKNLFTNALRFNLLPVKTGWDYTFGDMAVEIYGYKGTAPKQEKIKITTKDDAGKALKAGEITPKEYVNYLKILPK